MRPRRRPPPRGPLRRLHPQALTEWQRHLGEATGIRFALWDTEGRRLPGPEGSSSADEDKLPLLGHEEAVVSALIRRAAQGDEVVVEESGVGVVTLAVPVRFRRRMVGVAVGRYLAVEALAEPILSRLAAHLGVDGETARDRCAPLALYSLQAAGHLSRTVGMFFLLFFNKHTRSYYLHR